MTTSRRGVTVFVWQSLVVEGYRSFFVHLAKQEPFARRDLLLVAPSAFVELGRQERPCAPFAPPYVALRDLDALAAHDIETKPSLEHDPRRYALTLPAKAWHVQAVMFRGLGGLLRRAFKPSGRFHEAPSLDAFFICEPYALTTLGLLLQLFASRVRGRPRARVFLYTAQNIDKRLALPLRICEQLAYRACDGILSCGRTQDAVLRSHGFRGPILPFPLWYDAAIFRPPTQTPERLAGERFSLVFAGSFLAEKGLDDLLDAMDVYAADLLPSVTFLFAGRGPLEDRVRARVEAFNMARAPEGGTAFVLGALDQSALAALFARAVCVVVPSREEAHWKEQFGRVVVEAQACGARVAASRTGELPYVVAEQGLLFPQRNPVALARVLERVVLEELSGREGNATAERAARIAWNERFSDANCAQRFAGVMQNLDTQTQE